MEIGNLLKQTRLSKGYTLENIEEATKIRARYLEALEKEEFDLLPGQVYVIAFLRNYARFLGLNDDELVDQYKNKSTGSNVAIKEESENRSTEIKERPRRRHRQAQPQFIKLLATVAVIAVVFAIASIYKTYAPGNDVPQEPNVVQDDNKEKPTPTENNNKNVTPKAEDKDTTQPTKTVSGVELVLNVTDANCWMSIDIDGQRAFEGTVSAGDTKEFSGSESINVTLGNAGAVNVEYNGEKIGKLGPMGQVVKEQFKARQG